MEIKTISTNFPISQFVIYMLLLLLSITLSAKKLVSFPHKEHLEAEIECLECHIEIEKSTQASDSNLPSPELCSECHEPFAGLKEFISEKRIVTFSHKEHIKRETECSVCHFLKDTFDVILPGMETCFRCHDGIKASEKCTVCHINLLGGDLMPESHELSWLRLHRVQAVEEQHYCENCHKQSFCQECHIGDNVTPLSHRRNFLYTHQLEVSKREKDCRSCHETETFCLDCHREQMVMPFSHNSIDWSNTEDGGKHKIEARLDIESCAICHDTEGSICADCHE